MEEFKTVLKKYAVFKGRARRREFWTFVLLSAVISMALSVIDSILGTKVDNQEGWLSSIYSLAVFVPFVAVSVRRLHDTNRSGWWLLSPFIFIIVSLAFFPIIEMTAVFIAPMGAFLFGGVIIAFLLTDSNPGENKYGPSPKE